MSTCPGSGGYWAAAVAAGDSDAAVLAAAGQTGDQLGRRVRARWLEWAARQPAAVLAAHPSWLLLWDSLSPEDQQADAGIGTDLFCAGWHARGRRLPGGPPAPGHRALNEILRDAIRAARGDPAALPGLRAEYDAAAAALFTVLAGGRD